MCRSCYWKTMIFGVLMMKNNKHTLFILCLVFGSMLFSMLFLSSHRSDQKHVKNTNNIKEGLLHNSILQEKNGLAMRFAIPGKTIMEQSIEENLKNCFVPELLKRYFEANKSPCDYCKKHYKMCKGYAGFSFYCSTRCSSKYKSMFFEMFQNIDLSCESIYDMYNADIKNKKTKFELTHDYCAKYFYICLAFNELNKIPENINLNKMFSLFVRDGFRKVSENEYNLRNYVIEVPISSEFYTRIYTDAPFLFFYSHLIRCVWCAWHKRLCVRRINYHF